MSERLKIAILDDSQHCARSIADWSALEAIAEIEVYEYPFPDETFLITQLQPFDVIVPMRERTDLPERVVSSLPNLKLIAMTGPRVSPPIDVEAATRAGILVTNTGNEHSVISTAELTWAHVMASARHLTYADAVMRDRGWHADIPLGLNLAGKTIGIVGLGRIGTRVAGYARAFGMNVIAWSPNLTVERAFAAGARWVAKEELFATADVVSLHLVLSSSTKGIVGPSELGAMKPGAILVNTARGPLVDRMAMIEALSENRIVAGMDVYHMEPPDEGDTLRGLPNTVLTPHLGYGVDAVMRQFYSEAIDSILQWHAGRPVRMVNPEAWRGKPA